MANCKHGLTEGTCAYCSGLVTKPSEVGAGYGLIVIQGNHSIQRRQGAILGSFLEENQDLNRQDARHGGY